MKIGLVACRALGHDILWIPAHFLSSTPRILSVFFSAVSAVSAVNGFFTGSEGLRHSKLVKVRR